MKRVVLFVICALALVAPAATAQDAPVEIPPGWRTGVVAKLAGSQVGFSNWQGGGINSLAFTAGVEGESKKESVRFKQKVNLRLGIGAIKQDTLSLRKAEDAIFGAYVVRYKGDGFFAKWNPTFAADLRTQFLEGFDYGSQPEERVSDLFAPAYITQALGLTYGIDDWFSQRFGFGAKQTVVTIEELRASYGFQDDELDKSARLEAGIESQTQLTREIFKNVIYKSTLSLFAAFNNADKPDAIWENLLTMKVNDWLQTNLEVILMFDDDVKKEIQLREVFSVGVAFTLL